MNPNPVAPAAPAKSNKTVLIIGLVIGGFFMCCICSGVLAAVAIPNFIKFQARAKQSECKTNLRALYLAQVSHRDEEGDFADTAADLNFTTSGTTRYTYFGGPELIVGPSSLEESAIAEEELPPLAGERLPGVEGECSNECSIVIACAGNLDTDAQLDVWSISSAPREHDGKTIAAGELFHEADDVTQ